MMVAGCICFAHMGLVLLFAMLSEPGTLYYLGKLYPRASVFFDITSFLFDTVVGFVLFDASILVMKYSPDVKIIDDGGNTLLFQFTNQVFRNHFAELNGAE